MGYEDFWFIETRDQKRNLKRWFLWLVLMFAFVTVGSILAVKTMYRPIEKFEVQTKMPAVRVIEAKKTNVNGYIKGEIKNNSTTELSGKYMKFAFYTDDDMNLGVEYIDIGTLKSLELKTYELQFRYENVDSFIITVVDEKE